MKVLLQLSWFFKQRKKQYGLGVAALVFVSLLQLLPPKIIGLIVDDITEATLTASELTKWLIILAVAGILMYVSRYYWRVMIFGSAVLLSRTMREKLFNHFTRMSPSFYQKRRVGDLMAHATNDINAVQQTAGMGILTLVDSISTGGFVILTMALDNQLEIDINCTYSVSIHDIPDKLLWKNATQTFPFCARSILQFE